MPDIVYPVRPGEVNEELRFSLRSLRNLPDVGTVWIIGDMPKWVRGVKMIDGGNPTKNPHANVYRNVLLAMQHDGLPEDVVIFNDDFFVTEPVDSLPVGYRSTLAEHLNLPMLRTSTKSWWKESLVMTQACLHAQEIDDPLSYELHIPFPVKRSLMRATLEQFQRVTPDNPPQWRSLYGNLHPDPSAQRLKDGKQFRPGVLQYPFMSTTDLSWRHYRAAMLKLFPDPSPYEDS